MNTFQRFSLNNERNIIVTKFPDDVHFLECVMILEEIDTIVNFSENKYSFVPSKRIIHLPFKDGGVPNQTTIRTWLNIVSSIEARNILIHCDSSVGRAPLMLAIAMIQTNKSNGADVVQEIRNKINGALNTRQLKFVLTFNPKNKTSIKKFFGWFR